jgi:hypothetical protein
MQRPQPPKTEAVFMMGVERFSTLRVESKLPATPSQSPPSREQTFPKVGGLCVPTRRSFVHQHIRTKKGRAKATDHYRTGQRPGNGSSNVRKGTDPESSAASVTALFAPCQTFDAAMGRAVSKPEAVQMGLLTPDEQPNHRPAKLLASRLAGSTDPFMPPSR